MKKICVCFILILIMMNSNRALSLDCPLNITFDETELTAYMEFLPYEIWGSVEYSVVEFGNDSWGFKIDWSTLNNWMALHPYKITDSELKAMMYMVVIVDYFGSNCDFSGTREIVFYEETNCQIRRDCYFKVVAGTGIYCIDEGWTGWFAPEYYEYENEKYKRFSEWSNCGVSCCEFVHIIDCQFNTHGKNFIRILDTYRRTHPGSYCIPSSITDCLTGTNKNCIPTCVTN